VQNICWLNKILLCQKREGNMHIFVNILRVQGNLLAVIALREQIAATWVL